MKNSRIYTALLTFVFRKRVGFSFYLPIFSWCFHFSHLLNVHTFYLLIIMYIWKVLMFVLKSVSVFIFPLCQPWDSFLAFIFPSLSALSLKVWSLDQEHQHHLGIHQKCRFLESTKDLLSQKLGSGPSRWLWCRLEFANHWPNVQTLSLN